MPGNNLGVGVVEVDLVGGGGSVRRVGGMDERVERLVGGREGARECRLE